jgi:hypothetical protein
MLFVVFDFFPNGMYLPVGEAGPSPDISSYSEKDNWAEAEMYVEKRSDVGGLYGLQAIFYALERKSRD